MRYAGIIKNDIAGAPGVCVSFFTQGCARHCEGCQNPETWDFNGGKEFTTDTLDDIVNALTVNGIHRDFCIMGGEPLAPENLFLVDLIIEHIKEALPKTKIFLWTGYTMDELAMRREPHLKNIVDNIDCIIDGPFKIEQRDITLPMRGSRNQKVYYAPFDLWEKM